YSKYGCFEYHASGEGVARAAQCYLADSPDYQGPLRVSTTVTSRDVFKAYEENDRIARHVIQDAVQYWGMGVANMVSVFNLQKIILGGGVFEAADRFLDDIIIEARRWAQPIAFKEVTITLSGLGSDAGLYGSGYLALSALKKTTV